MFLRLLLEIGITAFLFVIVFFLITVVFRQVTIGLLMGIFGESRYYEVIEYRSIVFVGLFVLFSGILIYRTIAKLVNCVDSLADSVDIIITKKDAPIKLPNDLAPIESKLNEIRRTTALNEQAAREAEQRKNDLIVYLAHDLKTPLTSVLGYLTLLRDESQISDELREKYLSVALDKANRLEDLINEFFEITRFNLQNIALEPVNINLSVMLRQLADEFYPMLCEKDLAIRIAMPEGIFIQGDRDKLARVFDNLLRNAINYSFENTSIDIACKPENDNVVFTLQNRGNAIPPDKLERIFEQFFRLDTSRTSKTGGAGLGLAIAKQIVEAHSGRISAKSDLEKTSFTVKLPISSH